MEILESRGQISFTPVYSGHPFLDWFRNSVQYILIRNCLQDPGIDLPESEEEMFAAWASMRNRMNFVNSIFQESCSRLFSPVNFIEKGVRLFGGERHDAGFVKWESLLFQAGEFDCQMIRATMALGLVPSLIQTPDSAIRFSLNSAVQTFTVRIENGTLEFLEQVFPSRGWNNGKEWCFTTGKEGKDLLMNFQGPMVRHGREEL